MYGYSVSRHTICEGHFIQDPILYLIIIARDYSVTVLYFPNHFINLMKKGRLFFIWGIYIAYILSYHNTGLSHSNMIFPYVSKENKTS